MTRTIIVHSTTTCNPCKVVKKRLEREGIPFTEVVLDLPENAEYLAELKRRLERETISTPLIQYGTEYRQIDGLTDIISTYKEAHRG